MKYEKSNYTMMKIAITKDERDAAKRIAKSHGMTFQCWLADLLRNAISSSSSPKAISPNTPLSGEGEVSLPSNPSNGGTYDRV